MNCTVECENELPRVIVLPGAWAKITRELNRAANEGIARCGSPDEAVFVPLCALTHRAGQLRAPQLESTQLSDIAAIVVADALIPPRDMVELSALRIRFRPAQGSWAQTQSNFDAQLDAALERAPRLNVLARGHSHPFDEGRTHPSGPDRTEHLAPCLAFNRTLGIEAGFTFIAVRAQEIHGWALHCFATRDGQRVIDLGLAQLPSDSSDGARMLDTPFYATERGRELETSFKAALGDELKIERLALGWTRYRISSRSGARSVLAIPPDFPAAAGRRFICAEGYWVAEDVIDWRAYLPLEASVAPRPQECPS